MNTPPQMEQGTARQSQPGAAFQGPRDALERLAQEAEQTSARAREQIADASHRAAQGLDATRRRAASEVADQRAHLSGRIRQLGGALRASGDELAPSDAAVASLLGRAGDHAERVARYVDRADPRTLAHDLTVLARERPLVFYGGAFIAGLALGRFAKASAHAPRALDDAPRAAGPYPRVTP